MDSTTGSFLITCNHHHISNIIQVVLSYQPQWGPATLLLNNAAVTWNPGWQHQSLSKSPTVAKCPNHDHMTVGRPWKSQLQEMAASLLVQHHVNFEQLLSERSLSEDYLYILLLISCTSMASVQNKLCLPSLQIMFTAHFISPTILRAVCSNSVAPHPHSRNNVLQMKLRPPFEHKGWSHGLPAMERG